MSETETLSIQAATELLAATFKASGAPEKVAASVADALVSAEADGQVGHGFSRLEDYVAQARSGKIRADAEVEVTQAAPAALSVDANSGFAYPALDAAIERGSALAETQGTASISITNSHHCGALSVQVERIARKGLVGIMVANTPSAIAPWGAAAPLFGTNPIAFAAPRGEGAPLVIDLSLSQVARGKVMHAAKSGKTIPEGWALDAEGRPTTDPVEGLKGSMVPIGGAKGTALALIVEVLASAMTGANRSDQASSFFLADGPPPGVGQFLMILKPSEGFAERLEALLGLIEGMGGARLPGARRSEARAKAEMEGLTVPSAYVDAARRLAEA
ncbi:MAG: Ldh family oxidoreductase [Paracoccaceae bacterium]|nr:Ldh family oxidoreductase [Paracoccaceae bacterium]